MPILACKLSGNATCNRGLACDKGRDRNRSRELLVFMASSEPVPQRGTGGDEVTSNWQLGGEKV